MYNRYQVIVFVDLHSGVERVDPGLVEDEFGEADQVHHVRQLGLGGLQRRSRKPRQAT